VKGLDISSKYGIAPASRPRVGAGPCARPRGLWVITQTWRNLLFALLLLWGQARQGHLPRRHLPSALALTKGRGRHQGEHRGFVPRHRATGYRAAFALFALRKSLHLAYQMVGRLMKDGDASR